MDTAAARDRVLDIYRPYLLVLAHVQLGRGTSRISASDIVQQTLLEACRNWDQCRAQHDQERLAWLRRILAHNLADAFRALARHKRDALRERSLVAAVEGSSLRLQAWLAAEQPSPSQHAAQHEELLRLAGAIQRLPESQRLAVTLHHLQGLSLSELAQRLERTESAVAGLLHRGLKRLRELMTRQE